MENHAFGSLEESIVPLASPDPPLILILREREFICQINKQIKQIQISTVAGYQ